MASLLEEGRRIGVTELATGEGEAPVDRTVRRFRLPHNVDLDRIEDEEQRIAEVATKYLDAAKTLDEIGIRVIDDVDERESFLRKTCREEQARVWEATVHNLQSSYDTYVKNTVLEESDPRLPELRGFIAASLHVLEAVTILTHFVERHERGLRSDLADTVLQTVAPRSSVRDVTLNRLLVWAHEFMQRGVELATALLPSYTVASEAVLRVTDGITLHARPASLMVAIVQHHGTPVEMDVAGQTCNVGVDPRADGGDRIESGSSASTRCAATSGRCGISLRCSRRIWARTGSTSCRTRWRIFATRARGLAAR